MNRGVMRKRLKPHIDMFQHHPHNTRIYPGASILIPGSVTQNLLTPGFIRVPNNNP
jgi:hypothetical protein